MAGAAVGSVHRGLQGEVAKPDIIAPITPAGHAPSSCFPRSASSGSRCWASSVPGSPGFYEAGQIAVLKEDVEYVLTSVPLGELQEPARPDQVAEEYMKRSGGKTFDTNSGYSYDAVYVIADMLERAASLDDPDAIVDAIKKTNYAGGLMQYAGPIVFNEIGDNPNAITTMIQILGQKPVAVWPKDAALQKFVFPRPKA